jgi:hypothetical protein
MPRTVLAGRTRTVFDPMTGSGTASDVCRELGIVCRAGDIHQGFDACDPAAFAAAESFDFIWAHPPYWRMKLYADDPRDLSRSPTLDHFLQRYGQFIRNCAASLKAGGKLAILMGDYNDRDAGQVPLVFHTKRLAFDAGLPSTAPTSSGSATATAARRRSIAAASSPACMTSA